MVNTYRGPVIISGTVETSHAKAEQSIAVFTTLMAAGDIHYPMFDYTMGTTDITLHAVWQANTRNLMLMKGSAATASTSDLTFIPVYTDQEITLPDSS